MLPLQFNCKRIARRGPRKEIPTRSMFLELYFFLFKGGLIPEVILTLVPLSSITPCLSNTQTFSGLENQKKRMF